MRTFKGLRASILWGFLKGFWVLTAFFGIGLKEAFTELLVAFRVLGFLGFLGLWGLSGLSGIYGV